MRWRLILVADEDQGALTHGELVALVAMAQATFKLAQLGEVPDAAAYQSAIAKIMPVIERALEALRDEKFVQQIGALS